MKTISQLGKDFKVDIKVIVFPEPGGPQIKNALCSESHAPRINWCLKVSTVVIIKSESFTLLTSSSIF